MACGRKIYKGTRDNLQHRVRSTKNMPEGLITIFFLATTWFSAPRATHFLNASMESLNTVKFKMILNTNMVAPLLYLVLSFHPYYIVYSLLLSKRCLPGSKKPQRRVPKGI